MEAGAIAAIEGASGSGKTTLLKAIATLIAVDGGRVLLEGVDAAAIAPTTFRRRVAYVPQQPPMLEGSVADNLATGPRLRGATLSGAASSALLERVGLPASFGARAARDLSGGERQRVALARALANEPVALLLDEPTAALDPAAAARVLDLGARARGRGAQRGGGDPRRRARRAPGRRALGVPQRPPREARGRGVSYVAIPLSRLGVAVGLVAVAVALSRRAGLDLERDLALGTVRCAAQLLAIGYVLRLLFAEERWYWVALALAVMLLVAAFTSARRVEHGPGTRALFPLALAAIAAGAAVALVPVFTLIVAPRPWYEARYLVPIGGMMLASAMNVVAQVFERIFAAAHAEAAVVEQLLALGASPRQALAPQLRKAVRAALIPTINGLLTVGLVALPGMMTGQIVGGTEPEQAVRYQIVIMYQLVAVAAVSSTLAATFARRLLFTTRAQLRAIGDRG